MYDEVHVINQNPLCLVVAFDVSCSQPRFLQAQLHLIGNRLHLTRIGPVAQHKVVCESSRPLFHFEDAEFFGFLVEAGLNSSSNLLVQFSLLHSPIDCSQSFENFIVIQVFERLGRHY